MENIVFVFLIVCLVAVCVIPILSTFTPGSKVWFDVEDLIFENVE